MNTLNLPLVKRSVGEAKSSFIDLFEHNVFIKGQLKTETRMLLLPKECK